MDARYSVEVFYNYYGMYHEGYQVDYFQPVSSWQPLSHYELDKNLARMKGGEGELLKVLYDLEALVNTEKGHEMRNGKARVASYVDPWALVHSAIVELVPPPKPQTKKVAQNLGAEFKDVPLRSLQTHFFSNDNLMFSPTKMRQKSREFKAAWESSAVDLSDLIAESNRLQQRRK